MDPREVGGDRDGRKARFYSLTAAHTQLATEKENWGRFSGAINLVVEES